MFSLYVFLLFVFYLFYPCFLCLHFGIYLEICWLEVVGFWVLELVFFLILLSFVLFYLISFLHFFSPSCFITSIWFYYLFFFTFNTFYPIGIYLPISFIFFIPYSVYILFILIFFTSTSFVLFVCFTVYLLFLSWFYTSISLFSWYYLVWICIVWRQEWVKNSSRARHTLIFLLFLSIFVSDLQSVFVFLHICKYLFFYEY